MLLIEKTMSTTNPIPQRRPYSPYLHYHVKYDHHSNLVMQIQFAFRSSQS